MKKLSFALVALALLSFGACNSTTESNGQADSLAKVNDSLANVHPSLLDDDPWNDTTEYTPETFKNCCDTLVGNFSGKGVDTLIAEPIGQNTMLKNFKISSKNGTIPPLYFEEIYGIWMVPEGDLDGNGTEEFGIFWDSPSSTWSAYQVYTCIDGLWHLMVSTTRWLHHVDEGFTLDNAVKSSNRKGYITVLESQGCEDFYIETKKVKVNPQPIPKGIVHFARIVE